ncbi:tripartite motif-containing protein 2-like [Centruroides sculpturatus]|uniref:tripartite motif-containing protein 2-like n=1 Tax=Centruroides sculpturatus TaxID=218467 RepID=UPI000C6E5E08|nr:tripartite motif-containing protein 2-like [Centruroides sculpturatus]XP_023238721.1 tripartite motif-containing protein 2-like [Centruroides sculpturatus]
MTTLVETVSINYEDFNVTFLTCSTCFCMYDARTHTPKLLSCSHTVCLQCLENLVENSGARESGLFRCPICRKTIPLPRDGVRALPPSFVVNQLLDLMANQRREVIPKCSIHPSQELLFCETCDCVFCIICTNAIHGSSGCEHTVIPFSIAVKRLSEIFLYKAHLCSQKLNVASQNLNTEINKLDKNIEKALQQINSSFQQLKNDVVERKLALSDQLTEIYNNKKQVLKEQLKDIKEETEKLTEENDRLQFEVDISNLAKRISDLHVKHDSINNVMEPKENPFLSYTCDNTFDTETFKSFGNLRTSRTFPALCTATLEDTYAHLEATISVKTVDYFSNPQMEGGDIISCKAMYKNGDVIPVKIEDKKNGSYEIKYVPFRTGMYELHIAIFDRPIHNSPFILDASEHINPICQFGKRGSGNFDLSQPANVTAKNDVFVLDTSNNRIVVLNPQLEFLYHISNEGLKAFGSTGIAMSPRNTIFVVNWRTKLVTEMSLDGKTINQFTHDAFVEPIDITVNSQGEILVVDDYAKSVFLFNQTGKFLKMIGEKGNKEGQINLITSITNGPSDEIIISGTKLIIFNNKGMFLREICSKTAGQYSGIHYDNKGNILVTRSEKSGSYIQIIDYYTGEQKFIIDSYDSKLKRAAGIVSKDDYVYAIDLGNNCVKKYRYL